MDSQGSTTVALNGLEAQPTSIHYTVAPNMPGAASQLHKARRRLRETHEPERVGVAALVREQRRPLASENYF